MNILIDELPEIVEVDGKDHRINPNFRNIILAELAINDPELDEYERVAFVLDLFYADDPPGDVVAALGAFSEFYACYTPPEATTGRGKRKAQLEPVLSSEHDATLIYTAFLRTYGVNLNTVDNLHWFEYCAMLQDLDSECRLSKIMEYRGVNLSDIKDKAMKAFYRKMKRQYALPANKHTQARLDSITAALKGDGDLAEALRQ